MKIAGLLLIIVGVAALIYGGFTYTSQKKEVNIGDIQINKTENHSLPVPPILGIVAVVGGAALFYLGAKQRR
jgi:drug/metabolite transporter (DMT)-like permease